MRHYAQKWPIMRAKFGQIMRPVRIICLQEHHEADEAHVFTWSKKKLGELNFTSWSKS
jgi:hypothetical protein